MSDSATTPEGSPQSPEQFSAAAEPAAPEAEPVMEQAVSPPLSTAGEPGIQARRRRDLEDSEQNMVGSCVIIILISLFVVFYAGVGTVTARGELLIVFFGMLGILAAGAIINILTWART